MPKRLYVCEICGKRNDKTQIVCIKCVERDLLVFNDRFKSIEKRISILEDPLNEIFVDKHPERKRLFR